MIDFRYHVISLVAVLLALGVGVLMGTLAIGDNVVKDLRDRVKAVRDENDRRLAEVRRLEQRLEASQAFALAVQPRLTDGVLEGRPVVMLELPGTDGELTDAVRGAVEEAEGEVASTIVFGDKLALPGEAEREQLALILRSISSENADLIARTGAILGRRMALAAEEAAGEEPGPATDASQRLNDLLAELEDADFVGVDREDGKDAVPASALFLLIGGSTDKPLFDAPALVTQLALALGQEGRGVVAAEALDSTWDLTGALRDGETAEVVWTVDQASTIPGRIAVVLAIDRSLERPAQHYGVEPGATGVIPEPTPTG